MICSVLAVCGVGIVAVTSNYGMLRYDRDKAVEQKYNVPDENESGDESYDEQVAVDFSKYEGRFNEWFSVYEDVSTGTGDYLYDLTMKAFGSKSESNEDSGQDYKTYSDDVFLVYDFKPKTTTMEFKVCNQTSCNAENVRLYFEFDTGDNMLAELSFVPADYTVLARVTLPERAHKVRLVRILGSNTYRTCSKEYLLCERWSDLYLAGENTLEYDYDGDVLLLDRYGFVHQYVELSAKGKMPVAFGLVKYVKLEGLK